MPDRVKKNQDCKWHVWLLSQWSVFLCPRCFSMWPLIRKDQTFLHSCWRKSDFLVVVPVVVSDPWLVCCFSCLYPSPQKKKKNCASWMLVSLQMVLEACSCKCNAWNILNVSAWIVCYYVVTLCIHSSMKPFLQDF